MSELKDPELEELERRVSAAFAGTRPRRGFEDELWARLERRRGLRIPSWRFRAWPALSALAAVLLIGLGVLAVPRLTASRGSGGGQQAQTTSAAAQPARRASDGAGGAFRRRSWLPPCQPAHYRLPARHLSHEVTPS